MRDLLIRVFGSFVALILYSIDPKLFACLTGSAIIVLIMQAIERSKRKMRKHRTNQYLAVLANSPPPANVPKPFFAQSANGRMHEHRH